MYRPLLHAIFLLLLAVRITAPLPVTAQTFACEMSHTPDQHTVCADRYLRKLDMILADQQSDLRHYIRELKKTSPERARAVSRRLTDQQRQLIASRAQCDEDAACIARVYETAIAGTLTLWKTLLR